MTDTHSFFKSKVTNIEGPHIFNHVYCSYGAPGVEFSAVHAGERCVRRVYFVTGAARLLTLTDDNCVHVWDVNVKTQADNTDTYSLDHVRMSPMDTKLKSITATCMAGDGRLLIATESGNVYAYDPAADTLTDVCIFADAVMPRYRSAHSHLYSQ
jgi:lethal(2) giant larvae protein